MTVQTDKFSLCQFFSMTSALVEKLKGICLSIYPGLRNTCAELPKVVCSSCFKILRIHFKITWKTQEIAFQGFPISKFSPGGGACPRTPLDSSRLRREIVPPNFNALAPPLGMYTLCGVLKLEFLYYCHGHGIFKKCLGYMDGIYCIVK